MTAATSRYELDRAGLAARYPDLPRYRIGQIIDGMYGRLAEPGQITALPVELRRRLADDLPPALTEVTASVSERGQTIKFLWSLADDRRIETVLMHHRDGRSTVCVSTQAGCAMACSFCATGQAGFDRHLRTGEIVEQVIRAAQRAEGRRVSNVVFMGMGEPLANLDATWGAVERLHGELGIGARHLTISTVGLVPGIARLTERELPVTLAVSLHSANDADRDELVPINRRYPLAVLAEALEAYLAERHRRISFEWAMIDGVNDRPEHARQLAAFARPLRAHVNLIPLNPTPGYATRGTPLEQVHAFRDRLGQLGVNATVRRNRGTDIDAACGQLAAGNPIRPEPVRITPTRPGRDAPTG